MDHPSTTENFHEELQISCDAFNFEEILQMKRGYNNFGKADFAMYCLLFD